jgi:branched-chain amino acid transport system permease protein
VSLSNRKALLAGGWAAGLVIVYVILNRLLPEHLPLGVLLQGVVLGGLSSLIAMGLVLIYRSARIFNFAQAAIGGLAASVAIILVSGEHWSYYVAVPIGLAVAVATGWTVDAAVVQRFSRAPRLIFTVATIGLAQILGAIEIVLPNLTSHLSATTSFTTPFSFKFTVAPLVFTGNQLVAIIVVPVALGLLFWFFQTTDTGTAIRASADSSERALLLGIPVRRLSRITWMVAGGLSGVGAILSAPILGANIGVASGPQDLLLPLAAAVLAGMESLPATVLWSLVLNIVYQGVYWSYHQDTYVNVAVFFVVLIGLLFQRRKVSRVEGGELGDYVAAREVAPIPAALASLKEVKAFRIIGLLVVVAALFLAPLVFNDTWLVTLADIVIFGIIAMSLVTLTGWAGQISLGQYAFVGIGAAVTGSLMVHLHVEFFLAMLAAAAIGAAIACVIGIPALRIPGLYLAVVTLAFAVMVSTWVLSSTYFPWLDPSTVARPILFRRFELSSQRQFYELCVVMLLVSAYLARNFRRSRAGRTVLAVRDNPRAASAYGISPFRAKLVAFAFSGALAGVAGALTVLAQQGIGYAGFDPGMSVTVFAMVVIGGLGSLTGGVLGAIYVEGLSHLSDAWQLLAQGGGLLVLLMVLPEGLGGIVFRIRDWALAGLARRKGITDLSTASPSEDVGVADMEEVLGAVGGGRALSTQAMSVITREDTSPVAHDAALRLGALEDLEVQGRAPGEEGVQPDAGPAGGRPALIAVDDIRAAYGSSKVLYDVSFGVAQGEVVALLGTNGAGKSTTLRVVAGLMQPVSGTVSYIGEDVTSWSPAARVQSGLVTVLGGRGIFPSLSVAENLRMGGWVAKRHQHDEQFVKSATERVLQLFPRLGERMTQRAGLLSGGEQQMLALAQALLCRPKLLMIDELSLGLAPSVVGDLLEVVRALAASGVTVVVVEQSVNVATAISRRAVFMERGRVRFSGPTPDLSQQPKLLRSVFLHAANRAKRRRGDAGRQDAAFAMAAASYPAGPGAGAPPPVPSPEQLAAILGGGTATNGPDSPVATGPAPANPAPANPAPANPAGMVALPGISFPPAPVLQPAADSPNATATAAFAVIGASKQYGGVSALTDVSLSVAPGEILGIIGSNGAGKTTLFDVCSGFAIPDTGRVMLLGEDVTHVTPAQRAARGLGRVFQDARLFPSMTVSEALATALEQHVPVRDPLACALGLSAVVVSEAAVEARAKRLMSEMGLERFRDRFVSELSTGTRRIVELACAVAHEPRVLLLDEPTSGIAQRESEALGELLVGLRDQTGAAFVVIEHDVPLVSSIADRIACMHIGAVIAEGDTSSVLNDPAVLAAYLGSDEAGIEAAPGPVAVGAAASGPLGTVGAGATGGWGG